MQKKIFGKNELIIFLLLLPCFIALAQLPKVIIPDIPVPSHIIYIDFNGNDSNSGTFDAPKKTFNAAMQALPFGSAGINGGNTYAEIIFKSGDYYPKGNSGFVQNTSDWRKLENGILLYRNISMRGIGKVTLHGDSLTAGSQLLYLSGSGISVKNLNIANSKLHGVAIIGSNISHHKNVVIDSVRVDGAIDNGVWITGYDNVIVQHTSITNTCLRNYQGIGSCNWASALRVENSRHATLRNNDVFGNWGEGLNTSYVRNLNVHDNVLHDNYSVNLYCHSSSNAIYSHNLIYNIDSTFWRYCGGSAGRSGTGISLANELSCTNACFFYGNICGSVQSCCAELDYDHLIFQNVPYYQMDSVFIFNNVVLDAGIDTWDSFSGFNNYSNISNVFVRHNTIIGMSGDAKILKPAVSFNLQTPFINYKNFNFTNNIVSSDFSNEKIVNLLANTPNGLCNSAWATQTKMGYNLWNKKPKVSGLNLDTESEAGDLPYNISFSNLNPLVPGMNNKSLIYKVSVPNYIKDDFYHKPRVGKTNAGAIELDDLSADYDLKVSTPFIYPNPASNQLFFNESLVNAGISIQDMQGHIVKSISGFNGNFIDISGLGEGLYILNLNIKNNESKIKICIIR